MAYICQYASYLEFYYPFQIAINTLTSFSDFCWKWTKTIVVAAKSDVPRRVIFEARDILSVVELGAPICYYVLALRDPFVCDSLRLSVLLGVVCTGWRNGKRSAEKRIQVPRPSLAERESLEGGRAPPKLERLGAPGSAFPSHSACRYCPQTSLVQPSLCNSPSRAHPIHPVTDPYEDLCPRKPTHSRHSPRAIYSIFKQVIPQWSASCRTSHFSLGGRTPKQLGWAFAVDNRLLTRWKQSAQNSAGIQTLLDVRHPYESRKCGGSYKGQC